uniref:Putative Naphthalene 1,2-dioxygenase system ferredoxin subunit n=1 Tax=Magnetococcus massalia (strain MO-1) TaxID=451514 RepID=A0A1S7LF01_MAGMO|nr:putative Naphthalene 1,2-dioxygenase system ferredoxin subunit [Candidatus Magnetococcus massalia]
MEARVTWMGAGWYDICDEKEVCQGLFFAIETMGHALLLVRDGKRVYAVENRCPHLDESLEFGKVERGEIICPHHKARYRLRDGAPMGAPAKEHLTTFPVRAHDGRLEVQLVCL